MLTYFVPYSFGGSADYSRCQIRALAELGVSLDLVAPLSFREKLSPLVVARYTELVDRRPRKLPKPLRAAFFVKETLEAQHTLGKHLRTSRSDYVLLGDFSEYIAPVWEPMLRAQKQRRGFRFGCILHDPVRSFVRGPRWWHELSVRKTFRLLDHAFVHGPVSTQLIDSFPGLNFVEIPHGVFSDDIPVPSREDARRALGLPLCVPLFLQFGHLRDGKNLEAIIQSLTIAQEAHLVIAGEEVSGTQRGEAFYRALADRLGVQSRVHFRFGFVKEEEIPLLFSAANAVCLVYTKSFRSMSGVLAHAMTYQCPVISSSGEGPLKSIVQRYGLGVWLDDVSSDAIADAMVAVVRGKLPASEWRRCCEECSWKRNAELVAARIRS
jgi:glycosyltransferase involved in cell wall biosynthesis